jgi:hypothetical protein
MNDHGAAERRADEQTADAVIASHAKRLALELECLLMSSGDLATVSRWWASAHDALSEYQADVDRLYPPPSPATTATGRVS